MKESPEKALKKHMAGAPSGSNHQPFPQPKSLPQPTKVNPSIPVSVQSGKPNVAISQVQRLLTLEYLNDDVPV